MVGVQPGIREEEGLVQCCYIRCKSRQAKHYPVGYGEDLKNYLVLANATNNVLRTF